MTEPWFRCYCDIYRNRKLRNVSETFQLRYMWFLALHKEGKLVGAPISDIALELRLTNQEVEEALSALIEARLLLSDRTPKGWSDRQYNSDTSTDRVRRHRGAKRFGNVSVTPQSRAESETEQSQSRAEGEQSARASEPDRDVVQLDPDIVQPDPDRYAGVQVIRAVDHERRPSRGRTLDLTKPDREVIQPSEAQLVMLHDRANALGRPLLDTAADLRASLDRWEGKR